MYEYTTEPPSVLSSYSSESSFHFGVFFASYLRCLSTSFSFSPSFYGTRLFFTSVLSAALDWSSVVLLALLPISFSPLVSVRHRFLSVLRQSSSFPQQNLSFLSKAHSIFNCFFHPLCLWPLGVTHSKDRTLPKVKKLQIISRLRGLCLNGVECT